jgi:aryl-alcohol dehydrogenase-like predicted oxidoreductase
MTQLNGNSDWLQAVEMGLGTWQWGDRVMWGYGRGYGDSDVRAAFQASGGQGIHLVDTAEIYGNGRSERLLGEFVKEKNHPTVIATKFFPWPWRVTSSAVVRALKASLERIGVESVDLYQVHWPSPLLSPEQAMAGMVECVRQGLAHAVGVSNFGSSGMLRAHAALERAGLPLATNQVHYSLLNRQIERNGTLARCADLRIRVIAYTPLEAGLLTGKYGPKNPPPGLRQGRYAGILPRIAPLLELMAEIGKGRGGRSRAQVALNWVICKGAIPIPGAKTAMQALENAGALGWRLSGEEIDQLDRLSDQVAHAGST